MTEPFRYQADREAFFDLAARTRTLLAEFVHGQTINVPDWTARMSAIRDETMPLPLVIGVRYRMVILGGELSTKHMHAVDEAGEVHGLDLPMILEQSLVELEGIYRGRGPKDSPFAGQLILDMAGRLAACVDGDVFRCEEIR